MTRRPKEPQSVADGQPPSDEPGNQSRRFPVVGMGASAGGLEAFQSFFDHMPSDAGIAFVLVQHLDPHHGSLMPELLARHTRMPVRQATNQVRVEPDHVYIIPPNATLTIERGALRVDSPALGVRGVRTPIDGFFRSLAEDQGDHAVCILLSGSGTDGTLGLRAVKEHGGMAVAQVAESAKHDSIPRSAIATGLVDYILPVQEMPARLIEYVAHLRELQAEKGPEALWEEATDHLAKICVLLKRRTGHDFSQYKQGTLVRRIQRRVQVLRLSSVAAYMERLRQDPTEVEQLFRDLLIGVTHFFRDPQAFEVLAREVLPNILDRAGHEGAVRMWTPGCATGEEAYSVAILLREEMNRRDVRPRVQIFAGDIDEEALEIARQGRYLEGIAAQISPERLERFFVREEHSFLLAKDIREMCIFSTHNLIKDPPFSRLDLIVCRNLLIYLEPGMQRRAIQLFHYALRPDGYLFLGPSESVVGPSELFRTIDKKHRIFQRKETIVALPIPFLMGDPRPAPRFAGDRRTSPSEVHSLRGPQAPDQDPVSVLERVLVQNYSPAWVVINQQGETVYFSPRTGRYLEQPPGAPSVELVKMARTGLRVELRTAIHQALKTAKPVLRENVMVESNGELQRINLVVRPLVELGEDRGFFMVVFQELGAPRTKKQGQETEPPPGDNITQQLESELRLTKEHLQATIEEMETSNEELTSSNEELLSTNEELQSSNEELQTSKEELQSVNEELETVNAELSKKIEQLDRAHNDLVNLFASTQIAALFLDRELRIKKFTPAASELFHIRETDMGRPIADLTPPFTDGDFTDDIRGVLQTLAVKQRSVHLADGSALYMMRVLPYRRLDHVVDGVIVTFMDVTELSRARALQVQLAAIVESSQDAIVGWSFDGTITSWNAAAARMFGYGVAEAVGAPRSLIVPPDRLDEVKKVHERVESGEPMAPFESVRVAKDGRRVPVSVMISPVKDAQGKIVGASSIFRDLSDLARAKEALQTELHHKDEFLATLSHELRNPLAPLTTSLEVLRTPGASAQQAENAKEMMGRQVSHLTTLVDQLLDVSLVSSGKIQMRGEGLDLTVLVHMIVEDYRSLFEAHGLKLEAELPDRPVWVHGDPTRLSQAMGNLLHNAEKFTDKGFVRVALKVDPDASFAVLTIRDTGAGMSRESIGRLFQPFSQASRASARGRAGLGLGLALTRGLIESHGGTVEAKSDGPGRGSEFTIRLPFQSTRPRDAKETPRVEPAPVAGSPRRILIVEDSVDAAESLRLMLELAGHEVKVASDGKAALEKAGPFRPDVVLCDIGLPGGMDGHAVARAFRADPELRSIRLVALTGFGREEDQDRALEAGFDLHLRKPADPEELKHLLASPLPES